MKKVENEEEGEEPEEYYVVRKYRDTFLPSITLSLATEYFHKKLADLEVVLGRHIRIPVPEMFDPETGGLGALPDQPTADGGEGARTRSSSPSTRRGRC